MEGKVFKIKNGKVFKLIPVCSKFDELISLLSKSFNKSSEEMKNYCLYYIDSEGDTVVLENETDYNLLLDSLKNQNVNKIKIVFEKKIEEQEKKEEKKEKKTKKTSNENNNKIVHKNTQCAECGSYPIKGTRYKCSVCPNYDVCENCEKNTDHEHSFLKLKKPESLNNLISLMSLLPFGYYYNNNENDDNDDYNNNVYKSMPPQKNKKNNNDDDYYNYYSGYNNNNDNKKDKNVNKNEYHIPYYSNFDDYYYNYNNKNKENNIKTNKNKTNDDEDNNNYYYYSTFDNSKNNNKNNPENFYGFSFQKNKPFESTPTEEKPSSKSKVEKPNFNYNDYYFGYHPYNFAGNFYDNDYYKNYAQFYPQNEEHSNFNFSKKDFSYKLNEGNVLEFEIDEKDETKNVKISINNNGKKSWNKNFVFTNLKNYSAVKGENVIINKSVEPNENFEVNIQLNVKDLPKGEFVSTWALQNENKENLGEPIPISIKKK